MPDTIQSLQAEVKRLTTELTALRELWASHVCPPPPVSVSQCTCGSSIRCTVHFPGSQTIWVSQPNYCGGAAGGGYSYTVPMGTAANTAMVQLPSSAYINAAAGCNPAGQTFWLTNTGGECA